MKTKKGIRSHKRPYGPQYEKIYEHYKYKEILIWIKYDFIYIWNQILS